MYNFFGFPKNTHKVKKSWTSKSKLQYNCKDQHIYLFHSKCVELKLVRVGYSLTHAHIYF